MNFKQDAYDAVLDRWSTMELDDGRPPMGRSYDREFAERQARYQRERDAFSCPQPKRRIFPAVRRQVQALMDSLKTVTSVSHLKDAIRRSESESDTAWMNRMLRLEREFLSQLTEMEREQTQALADCANGMRALLIERGNDEHETVDRTPKEDRRRPQDPA